MGPQSRTTAMDIQGFRKAQMKTLSKEIGVYVLRDLDGAPVYVGQSQDGIAHRARRHLTSARSDIIANRQIDPWEIAYVDAYPARSKEEVGKIEAALYAKFDKEKPLMNGSIPKAPGETLKEIPKPTQTVQLLPDEEINVRKNPALRLPRQIEHIGRLVDHILTVKDSKQLRRSLSAHFGRLDTYRKEFLEAGKPVERPAGEEEVQEDDDND